MLKPYWQPNQVRLELQDFVTGKHTLAFIIKNRDGVSVDIILDILVLQN